MELSVPQLGDRESSYLTPYIIRAKARIELVARSLENPRVEVDSDSRVTRGLYRREVIRHRSFNGGGGNVDPIVNVRPAQVEVSGGEVCRGFTWPSCYVGSGRPGLRQGQEVLFSQQVFARLFRFKITRVG